MDLSVASRGSNSLRSNSIASIWNQALEHWPELHYRELLSTSCGLDDVDLLCLYNKSATSERAESNWHQQVHNQSTTIRGNGVRANVQVLDSKSRQWSLSVASSIHDAQSSVRTTSASTVSGAKPPTRDMTQVRATPPTRDMTQVRARNTIRCDTTRINTVWYDRLV